MNPRISILFVSCCLEPSRVDILHQVVANIKQQAPELSKSLCVFDNCSTQPGVVELLTSNFENVYKASQNVGYWSAVDWWLSKQSDIDFTYIIESDMIHYAFDSLKTCAELLLSDTSIGSVRLHEYSVENKHLYNKDVPVKNSKRNIWQSHTNKITGKPIELQQLSNTRLYVSNFLTQLPALNRFETMKDVFCSLRTMSSFTELDFQKLYHDHYVKTAILDGGIFHADPGSYGSKTITGSWTSQHELKRIGYKNTRIDSILPQESYQVIKI